jgi:hypothetical protein
VRYCEAHGHFGPSGARLSRQATRKNKCTCNWFVRVQLRKIPKTQGNHGIESGYYSLFFLGNSFRKPMISQNETLFHPKLFDTTRLSNRRPIPPLSFSPPTAPANSKMRGSGVTLLPGSCSEIDYRLTHAVSSSMYIPCLCRF